jgi:geranylgeranyl diphosphate synthase type I
VELDALDVELAVAQPHDEPVRGLGGDAQDIGDGRPIDDERVIARRVERDGEPLEHALLAVIDGGRLAVHEHRRTHHVAPVQLTDALVSEADAEDRTQPRERLDGRGGESRVVRRPRSRGDDQTVGRVGKDVRDRVRVVADDLDVSAELRQLLHQVVGEGVVVVDDEQAGGHGRSSDVGEASVGQPAPRKVPVAPNLPVLLRHAPAVDAAVAGAVARLADELRAIDPGLASVADTLVDAAKGGKRLRGALVRWSYVAHGGTDADDVTGASVAVELVHLSALVHDDVIDRSDLRRGRSSVHVRAAAEHPRPGSPTAAEHGRSVAVLLGDLILAAAPAGLQDCRVTASARDAALRALVRLQVEVMAGQYLDVDAVARRSADRERALTIATLKSGRYSVSRPLELGALLAGVAPTAAAGLLAVGDPLGIAFQLRDDLLGVFGDPGDTGKPAGSDLVEGKRTLLVAETLSRLDGSARSAFDALLGAPDLPADRVAEMAATVEASGARRAVEERIERAASEAVRAVETLPIDPAHRADLLELAAWMTLRSA